MTETRMLTDHEEIRTWAAARGGAPAVREPHPAHAGDAPTLLLVFGQQAYQDQDVGHDRADTVAGPQLVEWDEWLAIFDRRRLGLVVAAETPGQRYEFHEIVARGDG
ncbi:hypothetical protein N1F89_03930 [Aquibium sp. A9E412]|uniref:hypothetical protein n=1 Tax=Aquibium sp. A9E412 TaxID=2976767 RepID=UPI0025B0B873|nr:hypothetical protein [Aquibium sp. A9E412]MDN2565360.1 hypothetical protein [Aquibium sp. A9E412]